MTRFIITVLALAGCLAWAFPGAAAVLIEVNKTTQRMSVSVDGEPLHDWPVSTGKAGYRTPEGQYRPFRLEVEHYSKEWDNAPMPHAIFFTARGHAIHGSLESKRLGSPASHGCVRLSTADAATLFALVQEKGLAETRVVISGSDPVPVARTPAPARQAARKPSPSRSYAARAPAPSYRQPDGPGYADGYGPRYRAYPGAGWYGYGGPYGAGYYGGAYGRGGYGYGW